MKGKILTAKKWVRTGLVARAAMYCSFALSAPVSREWGAASGCGKGHSNDSVTR